MLSIDLKSEVRKAVGAEWEEFAARHPRLAKVIDRDVLVERATVEIAATAAFREAMERAAGAGVAAETVQQFLRPLVKRVLGGLL